MPTHPPLPQPALPFGLVETELRRRRAARGLHISSSLPEGALSWVPYLLQREYYDSLRRDAPLAMTLAVGEACFGSHSLFLDTEDRLHLACLREDIEAGKVGEPLLGHDGGLVAGASTVSVPPTLVPSMQDKRLVSVATSNRHCLALSAEGEVYTWGVEASGFHTDGSASDEPRRIETLEGIKIIASGMCTTSAAVDEHGSLFTWGRVRSPVVATAPVGLGYALDPETEFQWTPRRVDALSEVRVVGVAFGGCFTLAVTDAGEVFSFGHSESGWFDDVLGLALGHGSLGAEVLPRRIEALTETGRRFVAVAAGYHHSLALTEEGQVYGWGTDLANGHGQERRTPELVTALASESVSRLYAQGNSSCVVTEKGELYTWGFGGLHLGHGVTTSQLTPKRVEALGHVTVAAAAISGNHTLVADKDGGLWFFGKRSAFGLGDVAAPLAGDMVQPTPIPNLRVRTAP